MRNTMETSLGESRVGKEGALADLIPVNGNPLENLKFFNEPDKNQVLIMKDGKIFKDSVE